MQAAQLKADGKAQRVIVTGCLAQRYSEELAGCIGNCTDSNASDCRMILNICCIYSLAVCS